MTTGIRQGTLATVALFAMACGDASAPQPPATTPTGSALARHMDSLVVAAKSNLRDSLWAAVVESGEYVPAYGGTPAPVTVRTGSGIQTWQAFILEEATPGQDTSYYLWAYSDNAFSNLLFTGTSVMPGAIGGDISYLIMNDTVVVSGLVEMAVTTTSVGDSCMFTFGLENIPKEFAAGSCDLGTFTATVVAPFHGDSIAIGPQAITGVILK